LFVRVRRRRDSSNDYKESTATLKARPRIDIQRQVSSLRCRNSRYFGLLMTTVQGDVACLYCGSGQAFSSYGVGWMRGGPRLQLPLRTTLLKSQSNPPTPSRLLQLRFLQTSHVVVTHALRVFSAIVPYSAWSLLQHSVDLKVAGFGYFQGVAGTVAGTGRGV